MKSWQALGVSISFTLLLAACVVGPDYTPPKAETPAQFDAARAKAGISNETPKHLARWWETLDDPTLDTLVDDAVADNLDLKIADSRLRQARAQRNIAKGDRFPTLGASGSAQRSHASENSRPSGAAGIGTTNNLYSTGFDAGWELDLFGGIKRSVQASQADLQASAETLRDTLVSVLAEVALNYVEVRSFQTRLTIARENLKSQHETYALINSRHAAGLVQDVDLERARSNMENTRAFIPSLATSLERARNRLATLLGKQTGAVDNLLANDKPVPTPPINVAIGVPAEVLRRRPDVRRAERQLAAETARVGVATADLYPKLQLNGSIGLEALASGNLFEAASKTFGIGSIVNWALFSGGQIRNRIKVQDEVQQQAYLVWQQTVLGAVEEVQNALTAYANEQLRHAALQRSAKASARAATLARSRYDAGVADFIEVLDAERQRLSAEDALAVSNAEVTSDLIRLYKALGGGWESFAQRGQAA